MKKIAILALMISASIPAMSQSFADRLMDRYNVGYGEAVLLGGLARDFGLNDSVIFDLRNRYGYRDNDLLGAIYANKYGRASWDDIHRMRRSGMGWGEIAHAIGMHPGQFNKMRKNNKWSTDRDMFDDIWRDRFERKGTRTNDIDWARRQGISYRDAYIADQIRRARGSNFQNVVTNFKSSKKWVGSQKPLLGSGSSSTARSKSAVNKKAKSNPSKKNNGGLPKAKGNEKKKDDKQKGKGKGRGNGG